MDDQLARCEWAEKEGWGLVLESRTATTIKHSIKELFSLKSQPIKLNQPNGCRRISKYFSKILEVNIMNKSWMSPIEAIEYIFTLYSEILWCWTNEGRLRV